MAGRRDIRIDIIKGVAMFLTLWGHFIQTMLADASYFSNPAFKVIYSFHMPLFALMSGYLFYATMQRQSLRRLLTTRVTGILIPIIVWTTVSYVIEVVHGNVSLYYWWDHFTASDRWFLWGLLASMVVIAITEKALNRIPCGRWIGLIGGIAVMYVFPNIDTNLYLYLYVLIGYYGRKYRERLGAVRRYLWMAVPVWAVLMIYYDENSYIYTTGISLLRSQLGGRQQLCIDLYRYAVGLAGCLTVIWLVLILVGRWRTLDERVAVIGRYSMQLYILQGYCYNIFSNIWPQIYTRLGIKWNSSHHLVLDLVVAPLLSVVLAVFIIAISKGIERYPRVNRLLFGR